MNATMANRVHAAVNRQFFDPTNEEHLHSYLRFLKEARWGAVQFHCENPYTSVPETVATKFALHHIAVILGDK